MIRERCLIIGRSREYASQRRFVSTGCTSGLIARDFRALTGQNDPTEPKYTYLVFYSNVIDGKMWCPVSHRHFLAEISTVYELNLLSKKHSMEMRNLVSQILKQS